ncbi:MAG TPA: phospholipid carrier-dependent glycosyltransferase [Candidatus Eisenbacteria bacterium]|nr:phospholipid carrier-dependent glycosyltransferase [Candidatus Eisenbacteria bacterium]
MTEPAAAPRPLAWRILQDLVPGLLFAAALALYAHRLAIPERYIYDEVYHAYTAGEYVKANPDAYLWNTTAPREGVAYMWNHPPMGVLLIAGGIAIWGDHSFGWRFAPAIFGAAGIVLAYFLALRLTRRRGIALLTAIFLILNGLYFVQSRTAMLDIFGTFFMMAALLFFHRYLTSSQTDARELAFTGVFLGLAIATKWSAAYPAACVGIAVLILELRRGWSARAATAGSRLAGAAERLVFVALSLVAIPAVLYLASYIQFFALGHDLSQFVELQRQTLWYHSNLKESHDYASAWWSWPLAQRPVWYYVAYLEGWIANIYAGSNPFLSVAFVPAAAAMVLVWWRRRDPAWLVLLIGFFGQWLPWGLVPRIAFAYHFLPATPFGTIAVAAVLGMLWDRGARGRSVCAVYVLLVAAFFVFFYPIYAAVPLTNEAFGLRLWLPSWR